mmetsp:Transcript_37058/g.93628  ORF Transcript_37058/g.93628 Transcript_37058/m.93628 type:complete len:220 (-) Transcript_37058:97-756(-)
MSSVLWMMEWLSLRSRPFGRSFLPMPCMTPVRCRCSSGVRRRKPGSTSSSAHILRSLIFVSSSVRNSIHDACTGVGCFFFFPASFFFFSFFGFSFFCPITVFCESSTFRWLPINFRSDTSTRVALRASLSRFSCSTRCFSASSFRAASSCRFISASRAASASLASCSSRRFFSFGVSMCFTIGSFDGRSPPSSLATEDPIARTDCRGELASWPMSAALL